LDPAGSLYRRRSLGPVSVELGEPIYEQDAVVPEDLGMFPDAYAGAARGRAP